MDCTHYLPVAAWYPAASALADCPSSDEVYGMYGPHHESVATLLTSGPSAAVSAGNSSTLATVASFGLKPCWAACFQKALKSGGSGQLLNSSQCLDLKPEIIEVKRIRSAWFCWISCWATCPALVGLDWLSWTMMLIL